MNNKTFNLEDINDAFWRKVILITVIHSSGLGGAGSIWLVTDDKKEFVIFFDAFPYSEYKLEEFSPLFKKSDTMVDLRYPYLAEENGWVYFRNSHLTTVGGHALIRGDFYDAYIKAYESEDCREALGFSILHPPSVMGYALGLGGEPERFTEKIAYYKKLEEERQFKAYEEYRESIKLAKEHFDWKPLYANNDDGNTKFGEYALLFKEQFGKVEGYCFSIIYQREEISPLHYYGFNSRVERYNLFEKRLYDVQGPLTLATPESREDGFKDLFEISKTFEAQNTLCNSFVNEQGEFIRSFSTMEEAKEYAIDIANIRNYIDKENIITDLDNQERIYRNWLRKYEGILAFRQYYKEMLEVVCNYVYPSESMGGGGHISAAIQEKLHLDESLVNEMWKYIPMVLSTRTQEKARKIVEECKAFLNKKGGNDEKK